ncbi:hypothetical protein O0I10_012554 [Lichtheimia ornata]|uniref:PiggyBac transposable element-derived protein domain-containing protein n=1 Tax=Lichtheimia ornata TaxID=688661 RepID=A0AAD7XT41_9FUNG|nr:uncharacterized protein O0I10_012554 [Lichtheimia ornata]KAJ8651861.1 hypothetical protein O0I10_012554 [Lichtheimia ornata]
MVDSNTIKNKSKPHPIGQEYKTIADAQTKITLRLDISEKDDSNKKFSDHGKVPGCMLRLSEPWFASGRTIIADSYFGSPASAATLYQRGLYSILAIKKRRYWPKNVPKDLLDNLPESSGSHVCKVGEVDEVRMFTAALRDRRPQCVVSTCSTTLPASFVTHTVQVNGRSERVRSQRAAVFDEYGNSFGAIDANNNVRDNMTSYHDVMRTHKWEHRSFAFFWALAEANAFLAWRAFGPDELRNMDYCDFRERLAHEILVAYTNTDNANAQLDKTSPCLGPFASATT